MQTKQIHIMELYPYSMEIAISMKIGFQYYF
jgi:hypothetical protein